MRFPPIDLLSAIFVALAAGACSADAPKTNPSPSPPVASTQQPLWVNGDFENDPGGSASPTGWTVSQNLNPGITDTRPGQQTLESLNLAAGGLAMTSVVAGAPESQMDPDMGANGTVRFPKFGQRAVRVNYANATDAGIGKNKNVNGLKQSMTIGVGDVDPTDAKVHVRFAIAPILENPTHDYTEQPYYFVRLFNVTTGTVLYQDFNASGQPGVPWKTFTTPAGTQAGYTDWQLVDIAPGNAAMAVGDQVELTVAAAGCSLGGHWGRVYVDAVGSGLPGLYAWASGPQRANAGTNVTYTLNYKNGGTTTTTGTVLDLTTPPNTTFQSVSLAGCTKPAVGGTGTVSCPLGALANGAVGALTVTVKVKSTATSGTVITNGNYAIRATGISGLVGPKVNTTVTSGQAYSDVRVAIDDGVSAVGWGDPVHYVVTVTNAGPLAAPTVAVTDTMPPELMNVTWSCTASAGAICTSAGVGDIADTASLPVGGTATYAIDATVVAGAGSGTITHTVNATTSGATTDPDTTSDTAVDRDAVGATVPLTVTKTGVPSAGSVLSSPAQLHCGAGCTSDTESFLSGGQVELTAAPVAGATFAGWDGACAGLSPTCTLTMSSALAVSAKFVTAPTGIAASTGSGQATDVSTAFPAALAVLVTDASGNGVPNRVVTFAVPGAGASAVLGTTTATTDAAGVAMVGASANAIAGAYPVTAPLAGVATPATFGLVNHGPPATVTITGGDVQSATVGTAFASPLAVRVQDSAAQPLSGVTVSFMPPGAGATATTSAATAVTDATGTASVTAVAGNVAGAYSVGATAGAASATFGLTNTAGALASLSVLGGDAQTTAVTTAFGTPLAVKATDANGNPVAGASIAFAAPSAGATATFAATATTDASGVASVTATASSLAGSYSVGATASGIATSFGLTNVPGPAALVAVTGGADQRTVVTTAFGAALVATVTDAFGNPITGASVAFAGPAVGARATLASPAVVTDASGQAATLATASAVAGSYAVTASVATIPTPASFALTNVPGPIATLALVAGSPQTAQVRTTYPTALTVRARDAQGNLSPGASIGFSAPGAEPTASLSATSGTTSASGEASVTATAGTTAGTFSVAATASGVAPVTFTLTSTPAAPASVTVDDGDGQTTRVTTPYARSLAVVVRDVGGNPTPGVTVAFIATASPATASLSGPSAVTDAAGKASVIATADTHAGAFTVEASATGAMPATFHLVNTPGAAAAISAVAGSATQSAAVGTAFAHALGALVVDAWQNPVPGASVHYAGPGAEPAATLAGADVVADASGKVAVTATAGLVTGTYFVRASVPGVATPASFALENLAGAPSVVTLTGGSPQSATVGTYFGDALAVVVRDAHGNAVPGASVSFAAPAALPTGTLDASSVATDATGAAATRIAAGTRSGSFDVVASVTGAAAPVVFALRATPDAAAVITASPSSTPQSARVESSYAAALAVTVVDRFGNAVPGAQVHYTVPAGSPTVSLGAADATTDAAGGCAVSVRAGTASGDVVVHATVGGLGADFELTNLAGDPTTLVRLGGSPQTAVAATPYGAPLEVVVRDAHGNGVPKVVVRFAAPATGPKLSAEEVLTDASGAAHVNATAGAIAGSYTATATADGVTAPVAFLLTSAVGAPAHVVVDASGTPQATKVAHAFARPLGVTVTDALGNAVPGAAITWDTPAGGATAKLDALRVTTTTDGHASVTAIASDVAGGYAVKAAVVDAPGVEATFALTNLVDDATTIAITSGSGQHVRANDTFPAPLVFHVADALGNAVPGATIHVALPNEGATGTIVGGPVVTDALGDAPVTLSSGAMPGSFVVTATIDGGAAPALATMAIDAIATTTSLAVTMHALTVDKAFLADVRVVSEHGTPTGSVAVALADGTVLGTGALVDGAVSVPVRMPRPGHHVVHAVYAAQGAFAASASANVDVDAAPDSGTLSGGSCALVGRPAGSASRLGPFFLLAVVGLWRRSRRRAAATAAVVALTSLPGTAAAEPENALAIDRFHAAAAGSQWFMLDSVSFDGHVEPTFSVVGDYAHRPLVAYEADGARRAEVVRHALMLHAGASMALFGRLRLAATVPFAVAQGGERSDFNGVALAPPSGAALGDIAFAADVRLFGAETGPVRAAVGARVTVPTGARSQYVGDGVVGFEPRVAVAGTIADVEYATQASVVVRPETELAATPFRNELRVGAAAGVRFVAHRLLVGPEIIAAVPLTSGTGTGHPIEAWLGAHFALTRSVELGAAAGIGIHNAVGSPDQRALVSVTWRPAAAPRREVAVVIAGPPLREPLPPLAPPEPEPEPEPDAVAVTEATTPDADGAPVPDAPATELRIGKIHPKRIYFETDRYWIRENQEDKMRTIATYLRVHKDVTMLVEGHADEQGPNDHNGDLGVERATQVVGWLVRHGIDARRLEPRGYGATRPVSHGSTWGDHARNRRVEVRILTPADRSALDAAGQGASSTTAASTGTPGS